MSRYKQVAPYRKETATTCYTSISISAGTQRFNKQVPRSLIFRVSVLKHSPGRGLQFQLPQVCFHKFFYPLHIDKTVSRKPLL